MAITDLATVQAGKETTWGTAVVETVKFMGIESCEFTPIVESALLPELRASVAPSYNAALVKAGALAKIEGIATYEDFSYWIEGLCGIASPSGGNPYTYAGGAPLTSVATQRMFTLAKGDSVGSYKIAGAVVSKLALKGQNNAPLKFAAEFMGKQMSTVTLAALSDRTPTIPTGDQATIYVDAWGGTLGSTAISNTAFAFELSLDPGQFLQRYFGSLYAGAQTQRKWPADNNTLKLSMDFNATSKAYLDELIALTTGTLTQRQVRIKYTTGSTRIIQLDFCGTAVKSPTFAPERDGIVTMDLELKGTYHGTVANWFKYSNTNAVSALP